MSERDLIDLKAVAQMFGGLDYDHVRARVSRRPDFPAAFRIGARIMYDKSEISDWIESQRENKRATPILRHATL